LHAECGIRPTNEESYEAKFQQITEFIEHWRSNQRELVDRVTSDRILKCSLEVLTKRNGGSCPFSNIYKVSVGMILERIIITFPPPTHPQEVEELLLSAV
jgi:hypothetical protein